MSFSVIDCHTHVYPQELSSGPRTWAAMHQEPHWGTLVSPIDRLSIQDWATPKRMLKDMDAAGIDKTVLLGWYWEQVDTACWHNKIIAEWVATAPDRFIGFAAIQPKERVSEQLSAAADLGLCGVGELHHGVQGFDVDSAGWSELIDWCSYHNWPINLHVTGSIGRQHPDAVATPHDEIIALTESGPGTTFILAHWGGDLLLSNEYQTSELSLPGNVYFDCSASPLLHSPDIFERALKIAGKNKILFGSDYPLRLFPGKQKQADFVHYLNYIKEETPLKPEELKLIMGDNFKRVLG
ncbi:MAG: Uncharacterised protein [Opitutia bacterium UBA7350]|nr:MAG: Uncharacterised protein [Opitutae bacterium UBA7350]